MYVHLLIYIYMSIYVCIVFLKKQRLQGRVVVTSGKPPKNITTMLSMGGSGRKVPSSSRSDTPSFLKSSPMSVTRAAVTLSDSFE
jgi:hypothetical protein